MSEVEDATVTLARLLRSKLRVVKDDGALADVNVAGEWQNQNVEAFKNHDGQITVGLLEGTDQKFELSGASRRRQQLLRVNVWATDSTGAEESGRVMRRKLVEEVLRVVRQNRVKPNVTVYDFLPVGSVQHKAYTNTAEAAPDSQGWNEVAAEDYARLWYSDDDRLQLSSNGYGEFAVLLSRFKVESREKTLTNMALSFEGYGTAPSGNGVTVKVWNHEVEAWQNIQSGGAGGVDDTITITLTSNLPDYVDDEGYLWFLSETNHASDGQTPAVLNCDYVSLTVTVNGITYSDILSYRDVDRVDVKPFVYRTEITVKSWFFENIGV